MNAKNTFARKAIFVLCLLTIHPSFADSQLETQVEGIEILNAGEVIKILSAKPYVRKGSQRLSIKIARRDFTLFPRHSHLHLNIYGEEGKLLKTHYLTLSEFDFRHGPTGRHRDRYIHYDTGFRPIDVARVSIQSYERKHDHK